MSKKLEYPRQAKPVRNGYYDSVRYWSISTNHESSLVKTEGTNKKTSLEASISFFHQKSEQGFFYRRRLDPQITRLQGKILLLSFHHVFTNNRKLFLNQSKPTTVLKQEGYQTHHGDYAILSTCRETVLWNRSKQTDVFSDPEIQLLFQATFIRYLSNFRPAKNSHG